MTLFGGRGTERLTRCSKPSARDSSRRFASPRKVLAQATVSSVFNPLRWPSPSFWGEGPWPVRVSRPGARRLIRPWRGLVLFAPNVLLHKVAQPGSVGPEAYRPRAIALALHCRTPLAQAHGREAGFSSRPSTRTGERYHGLTAHHEWGAYLSLKCTDLDGTMMNLLRVWLVTSIVETAGRCARHR